MTGSGSFFETDLWSAGTKATEGSIPVENIASTGVGSSRSKP
jgi:hypothetical protein